MNVKRSAGLLPPEPKVLATYATSCGANFQLASQSRQGAVLICVMVVLLIVGLLISQTLQTLLLVRRGDEGREQLRQARELIELGEIVLRQNPSAESVGEFSCQTNSPESGSIGFERLKSTEAEKKKIRITVIYRPGTTSEITATHIVADKENAP